MLILHIGRNKYRAACIPNLRACPVQTSLRIWWNVRGLLLDFLPLSSHGSLSSSKRSGCLAISSTPPFIQQSACASEVHRAIWKTNPVLVASWTRRGQGSLRKNWPCLLAFVNTPHSQPGNLASVANSLSSNMTRSYMKFKGTTCQAEDYFRY